MPIVISIDKFPVVLLLGRLGLLLDRPFNTDYAHNDWLINNNIRCYDMYYIKTDFEQPDRVRLSHIQTQDIEPQEYYGTFLVKSEIPGDDLDTATDGSIHVNIADIIKVKEDNTNTMLRTCQQLVDNYIRAH